MGLLDSVLGRVLGGAGQQQAGGAGALIAIVAGMLANSAPGGAGSAAGGGGNGGNGGSGGLGDVMKSWIGAGQNQPISPDELGGVLGEDMLGKLTQQTGMNQGDLLGQLSQMLPQMVDRATPDGHIPEGGLGDIGTILGRFAQR